MGKRLCNNDFSFLPLVSSIKDQTKLPKSLSVVVQCFNKNIMFCVKSADLNETDEIQFTPIAKLACQGLTQVPPD